MTIVAGVAELAEEIDVARAQRALEAAESRRRSAAGRELAEEPRRRRCRRPGLVCALEAAVKLEGRPEPILSTAAARRAPCRRFPGMRFAFKTAPQNTNWEDMLAVWRAADDIELFESGWVFDHFYPIYSDSTGPCLEGWVTLTASGPGDDGAFASGRS